MPHDLATVALPGTERLLPGASYSSVRLRTDVGGAFQQLVHEAVSMGGVVSSSGGIRRPDAPVLRGRSARSLHMLGRAFDLGLPTIGYRPKGGDPFLVTRDDPVLWRVWLRVTAPHGEERELRVIGAQLAGCEATLRARVVSFTALAAKHGFARISARSRAAWDKPIDRVNGPLAEFWHFQFEAGLERGVTTYGSELLRVWSPAEIEGTAAWTHRDSVYGEGWA